VVVVNGLLGEAMSKQRWFGWSRWDQIGVWSAV